MQKRIEELHQSMTSSGRLLDPATIDQITAFEYQNKVKLPNEYKEWLLLSDGGDCYLPAGVQFYGVSHKPCIDINNSDRPNDAYIVIGALATGDPILCERSSERISIFNHEGGVIEEDESYSSFVEFLEDLTNILGLED